jgi:hypothetical protein
MYNVQDYNVLYDKAVLCDYWYCTQMWKDSHDDIISLRREVCIHQTGLTPQHFIEMMYRLFLILRFWYSISDSFQRCGILFLIVLYELYLSYDGPNGTQSSKNNGKYGVFDFEYTFTANPSGAPEFTTGFKWGSCYSIFYMDRCLSFCTFSFGQCAVCSSSIYEFWLPLWYFQILLVDIRALYNNCRIIFIAKREFQMCCHIKILNKLWDIAIYVIIVKLCMQEDHFPPLEVIVIVFILGIVVLIVLVNILVFKPWWFC